MPERTIAQRTPDQNPKRWSVVIVGRWNRAILTPLWIGKTLLSVQEGEPLHIEVAMDSIGPFRVTDRGLTVVADDQRLTIETQNSSMADLSRAIEIALQAMSELPKTPVLAAGVNIYHQHGADEHEQISRMWTTDLDDALAEADLPILERMAVRRLAWNSGHITFRVLMSSDGTSEPESGCWYNFERRSDEMQDLKDWLSTSVVEIEEAVKRIRAMVLRKVEA